MTTWCACIHSTELNQSQRDTTQCYDKELRLLGKGGFGTVTKARSELRSQIPDLLPRRKVSAFGTVWSILGPIHTDDQGFFKTSDPGNPWQSYVQPGKASGGSFTAQGELAMLHLRTLICICVDLP